MGPSCRARPTTRRCALSRSTAPGRGSRSVSRALAWSTGRSASAPGSAGGGQASRTALGHHAELRELGGRDHGGRRTRSRRQSVMTAWWLIARDVLLPVKTAPGSRRLLRRGRRCVADERRALGQAHALVEAAKQRVVAAAQQRELDGHVAAAGRRPARAPRRVGAQPDLHDGRPCRDVRPTYWPFLIGSVWMSGNWTDWPT